MRLPPHLPLPLPWRSVAKRTADILTVYGHGLLAFGVSKFFLVQIDFASALAVALGLACHAGACYISYIAEH